MVSGHRVNQKEGVITMYQAKYLLRKLEKYGLDQAKPQTIPCELAGYDKMSNDPIDSEWNYRELVGSLIICNDVYSPRPFVGSHQVVAASR